MEIWARCCLTESAGGFYFCRWRFRHQLSEAVGGGYSCCCLPESAGGGGFCRLLADSVGGGSGISCLQESAGGGILQVAGRGCRERWHWMLLADSVGWRFSPELSSRICRWRKLQVAGKSCRWRLLAVAVGVVSILSCLPESAGGGSCRFLAEAVDGGLGCS